jgi:hypothetical protein
MYNANFCPSSSTRTDVKNVYESWENQILGGQQLLTTIYKQDKKRWGQGLTLWFLFVIIRYIIDSGKTKMSRMLLASTSLG